MRRFPAEIGAALLAALACGALAGCYRHIVGVEGYGGQNVDFYEPNLKEKKGPLEQLDSTVWGDDQNQGKAKIVRGSPSTKKGW